MKTKRNRKAPAVKCVSCRTKTYNPIYVDMGQQGKTGPFCSCCGGGHIPVYEAQYRPSTPARDCADSRIECDLADCESCKRWVSCSIR